MRSLGHSERGREREKCGEENGKKSPECERKREHEWRVHTTLPLLLPWVDGEWMQGGDTVGIVGERTDEKIEQILFNI